MTLPNLMSANKKFTKMKPPEMSPNRRAVLPASELMIFLFIVSITCAKIEKF